MPTVFPICPRSIILATPLPIRGIEPLTRSIPTSHSATELNRQIWQECGESNTDKQFWRLLFYHWTTLLFGADNGTWIRNTGLEGRCVTITLCLHFVGRVGVEPTNLYGTNLSAFNLLLMSKLDILRFAFFSHLNTCPFMKKDRTWTCKISLSVWEQNPRRWRLPISPLSSKTRTFPLSGDSLPSPQLLTLLLTLLPS